MKRLLLLLLAALAAPLSAQAVDTTIVKVPYTDSVKVPYTDTVKVSRKDSVKVAYQDSVKVVVYRDSVFTAYKDSLFTAWYDSTFIAFRDSVFTAFRDSLVFTPRPVPTTGIDTTGFVLLARVTPTVQNDKGTGPVPLGAGGWAGQMYYDAAAPAPYTQAIRWFYRDGCWGGTSPGYAWFENGLAARRVHDTYYRTYLRFSDNWVGHAVGTKLMLLGFGQNGNQLILRQWGSPNSATGALTFGISYQGGSTTNWGRAVVGNGQPDGDGAWNLPSTVTLQRSRWYKIEIQTHAAPQGTGGSWIKLFVDDKLVLHIINMDLMNWAGDPYLAAVKQSPVWGGGTSCTAPGGQNMWMSQIYVSGR